MNDPVERASTNPWWLAFRVLDEPRTVFAELAVRPRVLVPFLVLFLFAPLVYAVASPASVFRAQIEQSITIAESRNPEAMTPERREQMLATAASPSRRAIATASIIVIGGLSAVIVTLVLNRRGSPPSHQRRLTVRPSSPVALPLRRSASHLRAIAWHHR